MAKNAILGEEGKNLVVISTKKIVISKKKSRYEISLCQYKGMKNCVYSEAVEKEYKFDAFTKELYESIEPFTNNNNVLFVFSRDTPLNILACIYSRADARFEADVVPFKGLYESRIGEESGPQLRLRDVCEKVFNESFPEITTAQEELAVLKRLLVDYAENSNLGEIKQGSSENTAKDGEAPVAQSVETEVESAPEAKSEGEQNGTGGENKPVKEIGPLGKKLLEYFHSSDAESIKYFYVVGIASTGFDIKKDSIFALAAKKFSLLKGAVEEDIKKSNVFFCNPRGEIDPKQLKLYSLDENIINMSPTEDIFVQNIKNYFSETEIVDAFFMNESTDLPILKELLRQHGAEINFSNVFSLVDLVKEISEMYGDEISENKMAIKPLARMFGCNQDLDFKTLSEEVIAMSRLLGVLLKNYEDYVFEKRKNERKTKE